MTLYLKYRPQKISDLDNVAVRDTLLKILKSGEIPHAFLFSGSKGTGKTSAARILAKALNCEKLSNERTKNNVTNIEPCGECEQCLTISRGENLDVMELDAASNRGIDDIRSLRESIKLSPTSARKKVYIIDEAHMLTVEASNALLKTLEEPPPHVVFVLATTNPEKLIPTIRSRVANITFKKAGRLEIFSRLKKIAAREGIKIDEETSNLIAGNADGSFRDAVKMFEEIQNEGIIEDFSLVKAYLEGKSSLNTDDLLNLFVKKDLKAIINYIENSIQNGTSVKQIIKTLLVSLQEKLLVSVGAVEGTGLDITREELIKLINFVEKAGRVENSIVEQIPLEVAVIEWCSVSEESTLKGGEEGIKVGNAKVKFSEKSTISKEVSGNGLPLEKKAAINTHDESRVSENDTHKENGMLLDSETLSVELWRKVLFQIKPVNTSTEALLRAARPMSINEDRLVIGVYYKFHKERLEERPHRDLLYETVSRVLGREVQIICQLTEPISEGFQETTLANNVAATDISSTTSTPVLTEAKDDDIIKVAEEIFGK